MPDIQTAQLFRREASRRRNPKGHGSCLRYWGADVASDFSPSVVGSGAKSPKSEYHELKPQVTAQHRHVVKEATLGGVSS